MYNVDAAGAQDLTDFGLCRIEKSHGFGQIHLIGLSSPGSPIRRHPG